jgi:DNA-binding NtrC family response regulator
VTAGASGDRKTVVLVVDDEPAIRLLCRVNLELGGYEVREAGTIDDARSRVAEGVDVVLLDMHIGNERGDVLLEELAAQSIPVGVVTGSTDLESLAGIGASAVLGKPFTIEELESTVARLAALGAAR